MSPWVDFHCSSCYWTLSVDLQLVSCQLSLIVTGDLGPFIDFCPELVNKRVNGLRGNTMWKTIQRKKNKIVNKSERKQRTAGYDSILHLFHCPMQ